MSDDQSRMTGLDTPIRHTRMTLCLALEALGRHIKRMDSGSADAALILDAAAEIMRLRGALRVNGVRAGATHWEIDAVIYPPEEEPANVG
jgi:hypothetical protein